MRLRAATREDVPALAAIEADSSQSRWDAAAFEAELCKPAGEAVRALEVAVEGGAVLGFAVWWGVVDEVHLLNVAVDPTARRQGIGRALVERVVAWARAQEARSVLLEVRAGNEPAKALYAALGFRRVGRRRRYYADGEDALLFDKPLEEA